MNVRDAPAACGMAGPLLAGVAILAATVVDPSFQWTTSALSDMGALPEGRAITAEFLRSNPQFLVFNGGLVVAGVVGLPFSWSLWNDASNRFHRAGAVAFALAMTALALVGVFHIPRPLHGLAAIAHYLAGTLLLWLHGTGTVLAGDVRRGLTTAWIGNIHLLFWIVWALFLRGTIPGLAVPETVGALLLGGWVIATARRRLGWPPVPGASRFAPAS